MLSIGVRYRRPKALCAPSPRGISNQLIAGLSRILPRYAEASRVSGRTATDCRFAERSAALPFHRGGVLPAALPFGPFEETRVDARSDCNAVPHRLPGRAADAVTRFHSWYAIRFRRSRAGPPVQQCVVSPPRKLSANRAAGATMPATRMNDDSSIALSRHPRWRPS
jgi:hypothetical protein